MLAISVLERTDTSILYEIPAGKPDPKQRRTLGEDPRNRVLQGAAKAAACWYYTFNYIRERIGKNAAEQLNTKRRIEKLCSQRRKALTEHDESLPLFATVITSNALTQAFKDIDSNRAKEIIKQKKSMSFIPRNGKASDEIKNMLLSLDEFANKSTCKTLYDFLVMKKFARRIELDMQFLADQGIDISEPLSSRIEIETKASFLDAVIRNVYAQLYGLHTSSWAPVQGINGLLTELKRNGPLAIGGSLGKGVYIDSPFKTTNQVSGRDIYAWRPGAVRNPTSIIGHSVLIVGAKKVQNKGFVYFIDPSDPSDPCDKARQKIYMISFPNLTSNIADLQNHIRSDSQAGYAYHGSFSI